MYHLTTPFENLRVTAKAIQQRVAFLLQKEKARLPSKSQAFKLLTSKLKQ
jgi:hypothetical protein